MIGQIDDTILTRGIVYNNEFVNMIRGRVNFLSLVMMYPGEEEILTPNEGALRVLRRVEVEKIY